MDSELNQQELEATQVDEELKAVQSAEVPADVKSEVLERLERFAETDLENELPEGTPPA